MRRPDKTAVILVALALAAILESFRQPWIILVTLPLTLIGMFWAESLILAETGSLSGPQLYFEIRRGSEALDPADWLLPVPEPRLPQPSNR